MATLPRNHHGGPSGLRRREFLALGGAAALTPWLTRVTAAVPLAGSGSASAVVTAAVERLSVGYLRGSDVADRLAELLGTAPAPGTGGIPESSPLEVIPATTVEPERELADTPLRVRIVGLYPGVPETDGPHAVDVDVLFPSPDPEVRGPFAFHAWSYHDAAVPMVSPPLRFTATPDPSVGLLILLTVQPAVTGGGHVFRDDALPTRTVRRAAALAAAAPPGTPRLREGLYLLGLDAAAWDAGAVLPRAPETWRTEVLSVIVMVAPAA